MESQGGGQRSGNNTFDISFHLHGDQRGLHLNTAATSSGSSPLRPGATPPQLVSCEAAICLSFAGKEEGFVAYTGQGRKPESSHPVFNRLRTHANTLVSVRLRVTVLELVRELCGRTPSKELESHTTQDPRDKEKPLAV